MLKIKITLFITLFILFACGLETVPYLPPPVKLAGDPGIINFQTPLCTSDEQKYYRGIEIYYKFYKNITIPESDTMISMQSNLETNGFYRLASSNDNVFDTVTVPLIKIPFDDRDDSFPITIDFNIASYQGEAVATSELGQINLRRGKTNNYYTQAEIDSNSILTATDLGHFKRFSDLSQTDPDISPLGALVPNETIKVAIYAVTYGKDNLVTVYSQPVYLDSADIFFTKR